MHQTTSESRTGGGEARPAAGVVIPVVPAPVVPGTLIAPAINIVDVPVAGRGRRSILHFGLDDRGQVRGQRPAQRRTQFVGRADANPAGSVGTGERRVVHLVGLAIAFEQAAEAGAVV